MGLIDRLDGHTVYLDTNIFIYILEGSKEYKNTLVDLLEAIEDKKIDCYTSELTLAEALVVPFKKGRTQHVKQYLELLYDQSVVSLIPTTDDLYVRAALYRAELNVALPDAIHVASALVADCDMFLTNDKKLKVPENIELVYL